MSPLSGYASCSSWSTHYQPVRFSRPSLLRCKPTTTILSPIVVHAVQAFYFRLWWLFPTAVLCGIIEVIGWSGRFWSSQSPYENTPFLIQCVLVVCFVASLSVSSPWLC